MRTYYLEGRKREEQVGELQNVARHKRGLTNWRGGRGKSGLGSFETWHVTNKDSLPGGEKEGGAGWRAQKDGTMKARTHLRGGRGRSELERSERRHVTNKDSLTGGEEEGKGGWRASKRGRSQTRTQFLEGRKWEKRVGELRNMARCKRGLT